MTKVKLRKGVCSYSTVYDGAEITATQDKRIVEVSDLAAEYLVSTGYFEEIYEPVNAGEEIDIDFGEDESDDGEDDKHPGAPETVELNKMNKGDLIAYAEKIGVTVDGNATKAEIKQAILDAINGGTSEIFTE